MPTCMACPARRRPRSRRPPRTRPPRRPGRPKNAAGAGSGTPRCGAAHLRAGGGRTAPPAGALKLIVEAIARGETQPQMSSFGHQTACELLGLTGNGAATDYRKLLLAELARASEKRAQVIALAMVLGAAEHGVRDVHTWQSAEDRYWASYGVSLAARYLAWLAAHTSYTLSGIEAEVAAHATGQATRPEDNGEQGENEPERDSDGTGKSQAPPETG